MPPQGIALTTVVPQLVLGKLVRGKEFFCGRDCGLGGVCRVKREYTHSTQREHIPRKGFGGLIKKRKTFRPENHGCDKASEKASACGCKIEFGESELRRSDAGNELADEVLIMAGGHEERNSFCHGAEYGN
ncbi:hypothetical protein HD554DRAFT_2039190 [Boletus coccyginus]|nr:hypothetical protein HD554DRAFT_2039190 [Boletus coccyginus]